MLGRSTTCAEHKRSHYGPLESRQRVRHEGVRIILPNSSLGRAHLLPNHPGRRELSCDEHCGREREGRMEEERNGRTVVPWC